MTILPSLTDYPDFGNPIGSRSVQLVRTTGLVGLPISLGSFDVSQFDTITLEAIGTAGTATQIAIGAQFYSSINDGSLFPIGNPQLTALAGVTASVDIPVLGPMVQFNLTGQPVFGTTNVTITITARNGHFACHYPGPLIVTPLQEVGAGVNIVTNAARVISGWATLLGRGNGGIGPNVWVEALNTAGVWEEIAGVTVFAAEPLRTLSFKLPPRQVRLIVQNAGTSTTGVGGTLMVANDGG